MRSVFRTLPNSRPLGFTYSLTRVLHLPWEWIYPTRTHFLPAKVGRRSSVITGAAYYYNPIIFLWTWREDVSSIPRPTKPRLGETQKENWSQRHHISRLFARSVTISVKHQWPVGCPPACQLLQKIQRSLEEILCLLLLSLLTFPKIWTTQNKNDSQGTQRRKEHILGKTCSRGG